jgi:nitrate/nitrite transporter NarK
MPAFRYSFPPAMSQLPAELPVSDRPTRVRFLVIGLATMMSVLLYLDRFCLSIVQDLIREDLGLTNRQMSWILSAFFLSYALGQVPSGWFSDRFGTRTMLTLYILLWSAFTAAMGLAVGFVTLMALRLGFGVAQAGAYPTAGSALSRWAPLSARGLASVVVAFGGRVGGFLAPLLTAYLIVLLVPPAHPSEFKPADLLQPVSLCRTLAEGEDAAGSIPSEIMRRFSDETRQMVRDFAAVADSSGAAATLSDKDLHELVRSLNLILPSEKFTLNAFVEDLSLPKEAQRLLKTSRDDWSLEEAQRVNRLVLEAAYPDSFRKVYVAGWRPTLIVYGIAGGLVAALFWLLFRNRPEDHPSCNAAEAGLIRQGRPPTAATTRSAIPLRPLMKSGNMWLCSLSQVGTNVGWVFLVTLLPRYLQEVYRVPIEQRGLMTAIPLFVGWFGMLLGGPLTDTMTRLAGLRLGRALPMGLSRFLGMAAYLLCLLPLADWFGTTWTPWVLTAAFSLVAFSTDLGVGAVWAFSQDVGGRHVGSVMGWGNMWGNLGAFATPPFLDWVLGPQGERWDLAFITCAAGFLVAGMAALAVDATKPVVPEDAGGEITSPA